MLKPLNIKDFGSSLMAPSAFFRVVEDIIPPLINSVAAPTRVQYTAPAMTIAMVVTVPAAIIAALIIVACLSDLAFSSSVSIFIL